MYQLSKLPWILKSSYFGCPFFFLCLAPLNHFLSFCLFCPHHYPLSVSSFFLPVAHPSVLDVLSSYLFCLFCSHLFHLYPPLSSLLCFPPFFFLLPFFTPSIFVSLFFKCYHPFLYCSPPISSLHLPFPSL